MQIRARNFFVVKFDQNVLPARFAEEIIVFTFRTVAPKDVFRLRQLGDVLHPIEHRLIRRLHITDSSGRRNGGRDIFHEC